MRKLRAGVVALALGATLAVAAPASAAPANQGAACVQAGLSTLKSLGLLQAAARKQLDYSTLANPATGPIYTTLPEGSYLSLGQVVKLHTTNPSCSPGAADPAAAPTPNDRPAAVTSGPPSGHVGHGGSVHLPMS
jgi:hypothetical protein